MSFVELFVISFPYEMLNLSLKVGSRIESEKISVLHLFQHTLNCAAKKVKSIRRVYIFMLKFDNHCKNEYFDNDKVPHVLTSEK